MEYLPEPPETVEAGPNTEAPSADQSWLPGCWVWQDDRYAWRPGTWAAVQANWVWVPAYYVWTPLGYVFVDGYWDYTISRRGTLFAPVYFAADVYSRPGFFYSPAMVINPAVFGMYLFLRPQYGHYYFGDYYADNYDTAGFYPWFSSNNYNGYDPIYAHQRWQHRGDRAWEQHVEADFQRLRDREDSRPPRTWVAQTERTRRAAPFDERSFAIAAPLTQLAQSKDSPLRFQPVEQAERQTLQERAQVVRQSRAERQSREFRATATSADRPAKELRPARVKLPRSPIVGRPADQLGVGRRRPRSKLVPIQIPNSSPSREIQLATRSRRERDRR